MFEVLHMLTVVCRPDLSAGPACSTEAEVWAGNVNKTLWSMKDLWILSASLGLICRWAVGKVAG